MSKQELLAQAVDVMARFKQEFGRPLEPSIIGELYVAYRLDLSFPSRRNEQGYDLKDKAGGRYQVKTREPTTLNVDLNSFDFDHLILFIMDKSYNPLGLWKLSADKAREIFTLREKYRKYQATQKLVKEHGEEVELLPWNGLIVTDQH